MKGRFQLVLHGHMPYVLHHGTWPHGSHWLYEAVLEVYLPLLEMLERRKMALTLGLTPVLLMQLRDPHFKSGFYKYLHDLLVSARNDGANPDICAIAKYWEELYDKRLKQFNAIDGDLITAFVQLAKEGNLELLSSFATHGYAPLLSRDESITLQIQTGLRISKSILGYQPKGIWLPECAFRPQLVDGGGRLRKGVDRILEEAGVEFFFVEDKAFSHARSEGLLLEKQFYKVDWEAVNTAPQWGWRSLLQPHWVSTVGKHSKIAAFARSPKLCAQVWSAEIGYPGDPLYLEFHRKKDGGGLRYWRVTDRSLDLGAKKLYAPELAQSRAKLHAYHFAKEIESALLHYAHSGQTGVLTC